MEDVDPFADDEESEPEQNSNSAAAARRIENKIKKLEKENEELKAYRAEQQAKEKKQTVAEAFTQAELNPKWAGLYSGEDATPEAVRAWALENDLIQAADDEVPVQQGYSPTVIEAPRVPTAKVFSRAEMEEIARENPARAQMLAEQGRVAWNNPQISER